MSSDSSRVSAEKLNRAEAERRFWKAKHEAAILRNEVETMSPDMFAGIEQKRLGTGKPTPMDRASEAFTRGTELRMFEKGLNQGEPGNPGKPAQSWTTQQATDYAKYLASIGKSPDEIQAHIFKLGATLDMASQEQYRNPFFQNMLMARTSETDKFGVKQFVESVEMIKTLEKPQNNDSTAAIITALGSFLAATKSNSSDNTATVQSLYAEMSKQQQASFDRHLELMRERYSDQPSFSDELQRLVGLQSSLGKITGRESEAVTTRRLELDHERWKAEMDAQTELRKSRSQNDMLKNITGNLTKVLESPTVRELGRNVGKRIPAVGAAADAFSQAKTAGAQEQLKDPLNIPYSFTCSKCRSEHRFTSGQLTMIQAQGGKWMCPSPGCGEVYILKGKDSGGKNDSDDASGGTPA